MITKSGHTKPLRQEVKHTVSSHFAREQLTAAKRLGIDEEALMREARLSHNLLSDKHARIAPQQLARLYKAIWKACDDEYSGLTATPSRYGVFSLACEFMLNASNLEEALLQAIRFYHKTSNPLRFELKTNATEVFFSLQLRNPELDENNHLLELLLLIWHRFPSWLVAEIIPLQEIHFSYSPPEHVEEYRLLYPGPCKFNQATNTLVWPKEALAWPVRRNKAQLEAFLNEIPLPWFRKQRYVENVTDQVTRILEDCHEETMISIEAIAESMHITSRTLRRKLTAEGSSFQSLKDTVNRDRAIYWLSQEHATVAEVSRKCGYTEPGAFIRAFKQWMGMSPGDYQKRLLNEK